MLGTVTREGDEIVIRIPVKNAHAFRIAMQPCPCRSSKSIATAETRSKIDAAITAAIFGRKGNNHE